jgi:hypothetical protein
MIAEPVLAPMQQLLIGGEWPDSVSGARAVVR